MTGHPPLPEPLPSPVVDTHCHLDIGAAGRDGEAGLAIGAALRDAAAVGVPEIVQVGVDVASSRSSVTMAKEHAGVLAAVALHPNEAPRIYEEHGLTMLEAGYEEIADLADDPRVAAIGETGLDFFRTEPAGRAVQEQSFRFHIQLAKRLGKALVIHDRDAHADVLRVLDAEGVPPIFVMHCFSGDAEFAQAVVERGGYCSFAGVVTFKNAHKLREALSVLPPERVLVETDAPFLTPAPFRGKPNASYLVPLTVRAIAEHTGVELTEMCQALQANAYAVFGRFQ